MAENPTTRNGGRLASARVSTLLAVEVDVSEATVATFSSPIHPLD
jgi:hypothetical protein